MFQKYFILVFFKKIPKYKKKTRKYHKNLRKSINQFMENKLNLIRIRRIITSYFFKKIIFFQINVNFCIRIKKIKHDINNN